MLLKNIFAKIKVKSEIFWSLLAIFSMAIFILTSLFFNESLLLYFFTLVLVFLATIKYPTAGLSCILLSTMWFERYFTLVPLQVGSAIYKIYPLDFCLLFLFISVVVRFIKGQYKWKFQPLDWFILFFGAISTLGLALSYWRNLNLAFAFGTYKNYFIYAIIYFLTVVILHNKNEWIKLVKWLTAGGVGLFFFLFYGLITGKGLWSEFTPLSTTGERLIAGTHIFYLMFFFFFILSFYIFNKEKNKMPIFKKILIFIGLSLCGVALVVSLVRHLWIAMIFILLFWLIFLPTLKLRLKYLATIIITGVLSVVFMFGYINLGKIIYSNDKNLEVEAPKTIIETSEVLTERVAVDQLAEGEDSSFHWRTEVWRTGYLAWLEKPLFGVGLGYEISGLVYDWPFHIALREIHNDYLAILYQLGAVGLLAVVGWFIYMWYRFFKDRSYLLSPTNNIASLFFSFWSIALLFMVGFVISIYWDINLFIIWWWVALALFRMVWQNYLVKNKI